MLRVAVVRALINKPKLLLADEPTGALDKASSKKLRKLLIDLNQQEQTALIVVTHNQELADNMSKVYNLKNRQLKEATSL